MTEAERDAARLIVTAADAWLPLALLAPRWLDALAAMASAGLVEYWPGSPDGPAATLTPMGAAVVEKEIQDHVEKRAVVVEKGDGKWWAPPKAEPPTTHVSNRQEVVPKWVDKGKAWAVRWPRHQREVPLWFAEGVADSRPGPAEQAQANEDEAFRRLTEHLFTGGAVAPVEGLAGGFGAAAGKDVPADTPKATRRVKRHKAKRARRAG